MRFLLMIAGVALAGASMAADTASGGLPLSAAQAQALALERNQDLAIAKSTVASARANVLAGGAAPNPVLGESTSSIDLGGHNGSGPLWRMRVDSIVSLSQLIERVGKR